MATLVVLRDGKLGALLPVERDGLQLGLDPEGAPAVLSPAQPGGILQLSLRGEGLRVRRLPGASAFRINDREVEDGTLFRDDRLTLGTWTLFFDPDTRPAAAGGPDDDPHGRLFEIVAGVMGEADASTLLQALLDEAVSRFDAERGFVLYRTRTRGPLAPVASHGMKAADVESRVSQTVVQEALERGRPILVADAAAEFGEAESIQAEGIRSILCAPLGQDAAFYLDSRVGSRCFGPVDLEVFTSFSGYARLALELWQDSDELRRQNARLEAETSPRPTSELVGGSSAAMRALTGELEQVAGEDVTVLLVGETGTGKEVLAREIHRLSPRQGGPFVAVNCMALSREVVESELFGHEKGAYTGATERRLGRFELADGGTLFLDEIGELSHEVQVKLLRVLQERVIERVGGSRPVPVDIRVVAATNREPEEAVREGSFREDLYYRVNVFTLRPPPLRERKQDLRELAEHFLAEFNRRMRKHVEGIEDGALEVLAAHDWPGNVRELRNVIERAMVLEKGPRITPASLPFGSASPRTGTGGQDFLEALPESMAEARDVFEKAFLLRALEACDWKVAATARRLDVPRSTIYRKCEQFGVDLKR